MGASHGRSYAEYSNILEARTSKSLEEQVLAVFQMLLGAGVGGHRKQGESRSKGSCVVAKVRWAQAWSRQC